MASSLDYASNAASCIRTLCCPTENNHPAGMMKISASFLAVFLPLPPFLRRDESTAVDRLFLPGVINVETKVSS